MLVTNVETEIHVILKKTDNFSAYEVLSAFDLVIELPDKTVAYDDGITGFGNATYVTPVTDIADGEITFNFTPTMSGIHKIMVSSGTASNYTILGTLQCAVIEPAATAKLIARLP